MNEMDILQDVSEKLENAGIHFMLTGSMAMNFYAKPRMTRDIDIVIELRGKEVATILALFNSEYYITTEAVEGAIRYESMFNIIHNETVIKVDFIVRKHTQYRMEEFKRRQRIRIDGFHTWAVSREDLILSKLDWMKDSGSEMQRRDIVNLVTDELDMDYLKAWAEHLGLSILLQQVLNDRHTA
jgi:hypothetical protein